MPTNLDNNEKSLLTAAHNITHMLHALQTLETIDSIHKVYECTVFPYNDLLVCTQQLLINPDAVCVSDFRR